MSRKGLRKPGSWARAGILLLVCTLAAAAQADIYKYVDKNGMVHLSDHREGPGYRLLIRTFKGWVPRKAAASTANRARFTAIVNAAAQRYQLNQALLHAVITAESGYDPDAVSRAGAVGLMQLMPETAQRYGVWNRRDPTQNIQAGARYLKELLSRFQNLRLALAAYNAGENAVAQYGNHVPPYEETQIYVEKVMKLFREFLDGENGNS